MDKKLPDALLADLKRCGLSHDLVLDVIFAATPKTPWIVATQIGCGGSYAVVRGSGYSMHSSLQEAMDEAQVLPGTSAAEPRPFRLVPLVPPGQLKLAFEHPVAFYGQVGQLVVLTCPPLTSTADAAQARRVIQQGLANARKQGQLAHDVELAVIPAGCELFRLEETKGDAQ